MNNRQQPKSAIEEHVMSGCRQLSRMQAGPAKDRLRQSLRPAFRLLQRKCGQTPSGFKAWSQKIGR